MPLVTGKVNLVMKMFGQHSRMASISHFPRGRLYFGGSKSRPNTIWGSRSIDFFNFDTGTGLDDESVEATINTNQLNSIVNIVAGADLRVFYWR